MTISERIFQEITRLSNKGNALLERGAISEAFHCFKNALDLLPNPKEKWEAYPWLKASLGECLYLEKQFEEACEYFWSVYNASGTNVNPYILLRLGECCTELHLPNAQDLLFRAFLLAGKDIFKMEPDKYFKSIEMYVNSDITPEVKHGSTKKKTSNPTCIRLADHVKEEYQKAREIASQFYSQADWHNYFASMDAAWQCIPEPKEKYAESFEFFIVYVPNALKHGYAVKAMEWIPAIQIAGTHRPDTGEKEYYIGSIYFENGLINMAGEMFKIANEKSRGRAIIDKKYKKFYKEWISRNL